MSQPQLQNFENTVELLLKMSYSILVQYNKIQEELKNAYFQKKIFSKYPHESRDKLQEKVIKYLLQNIELARKVYDEFDAFLTKLFSNKIEGKLFLEEVWTGDQYGKSGVSGLEEMISEMKQNSVNLQIENFLKNI